jgi:tRNA pseudouridine38-40 synthase
VLFYTFLCSIEQQRYFLHLAFNGKSYHGWQRQPNAISVQETIETALQRVLKRPVPVLGCGRTDALVHASQYFCHADLPATFAFDATERFNRAFPADISLFDVLTVAPKANARFDATERTYDYFLHFEKDAFLDGRSTWLHDVALNTAAMRQAVGVLTRYDDYYAFCKSPAKFNTTICRVKAAGLWVSADGKRLRFQITANRFLTGMVRIIVGRLLEVGRNRMSVEQFEHHLRDKKTPRCITGAFPQGLYLSKICYPYLEMPQRTHSTGVFLNDVPGFWIPL